MLTVGLNRAAGAPLRILCLGAHSDDIEIGCGGTLLKILSSGDDIHVRWVVLGAAGRRAEEACTSATRFLEGAAVKQIEVKSFRDGFFPYIGGEIKDYFEELKAQYVPDLIWTHYRDDRHQDHRVVSDLTWNTYRNHMILEYEIPKYDGDLGSPNVFVPLDSATCRRKVQVMIESFRTQENRQWFTDETFMSLLRLRGIESGSATGYAEGFYCRKATVDFVSR